MIVTIVTTPTMEGRDVVQSWMLCISTKSKAYINQGYNAQCSWFTINAMQFKILNQLAMHTVSALKIGMTVAISCFNGTS